MGVCLKASRLSKQLGKKRFVLTGHRSSQRDTGPFSPCRRAAENSECRGRSPVQSVSGFKFLLWFRLRSLQLLLDLPKRSKAQGPLLQRLVRIGHLPWSILCPGKSSALRHPLRSRLRKLLIVVTLRIVESQVQLRPSRQPRSSG